MTEITVICPKCGDEQPVPHLFTAQSNQNMIYECRSCPYEQRNIPTQKG